ncbi:MAG: TonB-dependent receptor [Hyphomonadaceae bacterium]|nr:TonB-dependent receptor [Hyphomonadaceae bacterium]
MQTKLIRALSLAGASATALTLGIADAWAQETEDRVVVTARRVEERLQDVPLSVTVMTGADLEDAQISSTDDLDQITPSLQFAAVAPISGNNSASQVFIRGIGQTDPTAGVDPGVGLYIDGVYMGWAVGGIMDFRDIANVQVLRGPQGTLFGRNTIGGAILIATQDPGDTFGGQARVAYGTDNLYEGFAAVDIPITSEFRTRWTIGRRLRDGYVTRSFDGQDLGDDDSLTLTGKAILEPADYVRFELNLDYTREDENGTPLVFAAINNGPPLFTAPPNGAAFPRVASFNAGCPGMASPASQVPQGPDHDPRCANNSWNDGPFIANGTFPIGSKLDNWGMAFTADVDITEAISFKSITGFRELKWDGSRDADNTPLRILHTEYHSDGEQFSQEFQLNYVTEPFTLVSGLYYFNSETVDDVLAHLGVAPLPDHNDNTITNENWAAYSQATYNVTDALSISAGIRYTEETKGSLPGQFNEGNPANVYVLPILFERDYSSTIGSASVRYRWNEAMMTYASWSQGFKSGGFNSRFNAPVPADPVTGAPALTPPAFGPENAESYEIGIKLDPAPKLRINLAAFHTTYDDIQLTYRFGVAPYIFNAGEATIKGFEGEFFFEPTDDWTLDANFSYLDDQFERVATVTFGGQQPTSVPVTLASQLPYVPEWQGGAAAQYAAHLGSFVLTTRGEVVHVGSQFFDTGNTPQIAQTEDVTTYNVSLTLEKDSDPWRLKLAFRNLTDEVYPVAGNSSLTTGAGYAEIAYDRGSETVISLSTRF